MYSFNGQCSSSHFFKRILTLEEENDKLERYIKQVENALIGAEKDIKLQAVLIVQKNNTITILTWCLFYIGCFNVILILLF
jgi:hypothetical protein